MPSHPSDGPSAVLPVFEAFQKARIEMVQAVAELAVPPTHRSGAEAKRPSAREETEYRACIEALENYRVQLRQTVAPLCFDQVTGVQLSALIALSRLSRASDKLADGLANGSLLPHVCHILASPLSRRDIKLAAAQLLLQVVREPKYVEQAIEAGAIAQLIESFEEYEPDLKVAALWCIGACAVSGAQGASSLIELGAVRPASLCLGEKELRLQRIAASTLADIAKWEEPLAEAVNAGGGVAVLAPALSCRCPIVRTQALRCIAHLVKWGPGSTDRVPADMYPTLVQLMNDSDAAVCQNAATVVRELCRNDAKVAEQLVEAGCLAALLSVLTGGRGSPAAPAMCFGIIGGYSEELALAVLDSGALPVLVQGLRLSGASHIRVIVADALAAIGSQSSDAADAIAAVGALPVLQSLVGVPDEAEAKAAKEALRALAPNVHQFDALLEMLEAAVHAPTTLPAALSAIAGAFREGDDVGRHQAHFVAAGHMRALQVMREGADAQLRMAIDELNGTFPEEVVEQLQPGYEATLLEQLGGDDEDGQAGGKG